MPLNPAPADQPEPESTEEQSTKDQAGTAEPEVEEKESEGEGSVDLLPDEEFNKLKGDPEALRKALNKAATQKFQELSAQKKALSPYLDFFEAMERDPRAATTALARALGLEVAAPKSAAEAGRATADVTDQISEKVRKALGPEYEDLADRLAPALREVASMVVAEASRPLVDSLAQVIDTSAVREAKAAIEAFSKDHPDWHKYEEAMVDLSRRLPPGEGMDEQEYLGILYDVVTRDSRRGDAARRLVERVNRSTSRPGERPRSVPESSISKGPAGRTPTFAEAAAAALRGETLD